MNEYSPYFIVFIVLFLLGLTYFMHRFFRQRNILVKKRKQEDELKMRKALLAQQQLVEEQRRRQELSRQREEAKEKEEKERQEILKKEKEMEDKGLVRIFRHDRYIWVSPQEKEEIEKLEKDMRYNFPDMNPSSFSGFLQRLFAQQGFIVRGFPSEGSSDIDFLAEKDEVKALVKIFKRERDDLVAKGEVNVILEALPRYNVNKAYVITTSSFTEDARDLEKAIESTANLVGGASKRLELWDFQRLYEIVDLYYLKGR
ncbi:restriction endonuclease [Candidatus Altiarchaeota archaeon]